MRNLPPPDSMKIPSPRLFPVESEVLTEKSDHNVRVRPNRRATATHQGNPKIRSNAAISNRNTGGPCARRSSHSASGRSFLLSWSKLGCRAASQRRQ
eukprot:scaffold5454_cov176-Amphora_coffeaeformis.AAC.11